MAILFIPELLSLKIRNMRSIIAAILFTPYLFSLSLIQNPELNSRNTSGYQPDSIQADTLIQMERTVCFGICPAYELTIQKDGKVIFNGKQFVEHTGIATGEISQENLDQIIKNINESYFMDIPSDPECKSRFTDMPSVFLTINVDGKSHNVSHYHGCKGFQFEKELFELEEAIDSLAGAKKWVEE